MILLHDSIVSKPSKFYGEGKRYTYGVNQFVDELKADEAWQVLDLPHRNGLTLIRPVQPTIS